MTVRGRVTLCVLLGSLASAALAAHGALRGSVREASVGPPPAAPRASAPRSVPGESAPEPARLAAARPAAPPPATRVSAQGPPGASVPWDVLERLPVTPRDAAALPPVTLDASGPLGPHPGPFGTTPDGRVVEWLDAPSTGGPDGPRGPLRVEYTLDAELMRRVLQVLQRAKVEWGHVIVLRPDDGRVLAWVSTAPRALPPTRTYPAASLIKVVTAAEALARAPDAARSPCVFRGSPYRLTRARLAPPRSGRIASLERALAASNNQCFARLAVHALGSQAMLRAIERFGLLEPPAPGHEAGRADPGEDDLALGRLGSGLGGAHITPLHAAQLAASLAHGELVRPRWLETVSDADGAHLALPAPPPGRRVMSPALSAELRAMLVHTTTRGTARHAFRDRRGRPVLGEVKVAGKTGSLTGLDPPGRYEWFIGAAPAERPEVAVAVLYVHGDLWWKTASQIGALVLREIFCDDGRCGPGHAGRFLHPPSREVAGAAGASAGRGG